MKAEREKRAAVLEAEGLRQAESCAPRARSSRRSSRPRDARRRPSATPRRASASPRRRRRPPRWSATRSAAAISPRRTSSSPKNTSRPCARSRRRRTRRSSSCRSRRRPCRHARRHRGTDQIRLRRSGAGPNMPAHAPCRRPAGRTRASHDRGAFIGLGAWAWIILGLVLFGLELIGAGLFFLWLGIAAVVTGLLDAVLGLSWQTAVLFFAAALGRRGRSGAVRHDRLQDAAGDRCRARSTSAASP